MYNYAADWMLSRAAWLSEQYAHDYTGLRDQEMTYRDFFDQAPAMNPRAELIKGKVCGVQLETIEDPMMQKIRWLDKLVDGLAKGRPLEEVLR